MDQNEVGDKMGHEGMFEKKGNDFAKDEMIGVDIDTHSPGYRPVQFTSAPVSLTQVISGNEIPIYGQLLTSAITFF